MNNVALMGRLTRDPEIRYTDSEAPLAIARYTLAVDRRFKREGEQSADFIRCVSFGKAAEHAEKYFRQGTKIAITGRVQTGSYKNKDGQTVYTTDIVIETQEFCENKAPASRAAAARDDGSPLGSALEGAEADDDGFMNIPEGIDEDLPFN